MNNKYTKTILRPQEENCQYGFVDKNGNWIINPIYEDVDVFREEVCWVKLKDKWGLIDRNGEFLIHPRFDGAREFNEGLANVKIANKWGVVDKEGNIIIRPEFDYIDSFKNGVAYIKNQGKYGFVFLDGNRIIPAEFDDVRGFSEGLAAVMTDGRWGYIDTAGKMAIDPEYISAGKFRNGKAFVEREEEGGFIDKNGNVVGKFQEKEYDDKWSYEDEPWYDRGIRTLHGFIDKKGKYIIKPKFRSASTFNNGLATVKIDRKWGLIDKTGAYVIEPKYEFLKLETEELYKVRLNGKEYFIDKDDNQVTFDEPSYPARSFEEPVSKVFETFIIDEKYGVKDKDGKIIIQPKYDYLFYDNNEDIFIIRKGDKWGILDSKGGIIIKPKYETLRFSEGLAAVKVKGKWGFIDKTGDMVIQPRFDKAEEFENGQAHIKLNGKLGIIDKKGEYIVKPVFSNLGSRFENGYIRVAVPKHDNLFIDLWGVMNDKGVYVVSPEYEYIMRSVNEEMARVRKGEDFGFADCRSGNRIAPVFDYVWDFSNGLAHIRLTENQIENGVLTKSIYTESRDKGLAYNQKIYDNWEEKPMKKTNEKKPIVTIPDLFADENI